MASACAPEVVELARSLLSARRSAFAHLPRARAEVEVRNETKAFWKQIEHLAGFLDDEEKLWTMLVAGGVRDAQARRWSREIVRDEHDEQIELRDALVCAHCGSAISPSRPGQECGVCGQPQGSAPD
jgi:rubrerythrin